MFYKKVTIGVVSILLIYLIEITIAFFNPIQNKIMTYKEVLVAGPNDALYVSGECDLYDDSTSFEYCKENGYKIYKLKKSSYYYNEELYPSAKIVEEDGDKYFLMHDDLYIETKRESKKLDTPFTFIENIYIDHYPKEMIPKYDYNIIISKDELGNNDILEIKSIVINNNSLIVEKCDKKEFIKEFD